MMPQENILHFPNLKTVLMVEGVLKESDGPISKNELKRRLPSKVMHQTLNIIIDYLEESGKLFKPLKYFSILYNTIRNY
ncbi:MAG: hypothetical protein MSIBF_05080 [Candidatus Altiarchaeales archaeon IMC4]|nr:MAG: hypothetical protein MSIBF_05080 [Candidatus Altiarchaeales archaeon IMC4]